MAGFNFNVNNGDGRFKAPRQSSIFTDGVEFTIVKTITGVWTNDSGTVINKDDSNSIRFETSLSSNQDDLLNINRLVGKKTVVYDQNGRASILYAADFHEKLRNFLEEKVGRDESDKRFYKGTAKQIGDRVVSEFFAGKTIVCREVPNIFFKTVKDGVEKLEAPYDAVIVFSFKE